MKEVLTQEEIKILFVDDEKNVLNALQRLFLDDDYTILLASSGEEGLEVLKEEENVQIVISDYRMLGMNGVTFLKEVCKFWPDTVRIVLSGYADTTAVISAINDGEIYKFIPKPWNDDELKVTIFNAIERYDLYKKNKILIQQLSNKQAELKSLSIYENCEGIAISINSDSNYIKDFFAVSDKALLNDLNEFVERSIKIQDPIGNSTTVKRNGKIRGLYTRCSDKQSRIILQIDLEDV